MCLKPTMSVEAMIEIATEGVKKFRPGAELYIRPMYWAERWLRMSSVPPDPESTRFCLRLRGADASADRLSMTLSPFRRPTIEPCRSKPRPAASIPTTGGR